MTVHDAVARERTRALRLTVATGGGIAIAATLLLLVAGAALLGDGRWLALPREVPLAVWVLVLAVDAGVAWWAWRRSRATTMASIAAAIEREQALRAGTVRGALEVATAGPLGQHAARAVAHDLQRRGDVLAPGLRRIASRRALTAAGVAVAAGIAAVAIAPAFGDGLLAVLRPARAYNGSLVPALAFRDMPADLLRGEPVRVAVSAPGRARIDIAHRALGGGWKVVQVEVHDGVARLDLGAMRSTVHLVASDGRTHTDTTAVMLAERPFIGGVTMRAVYPPYLGRAPESLPGSGRISLPRGAVLALGGRSSVSLDHVALASGSDTVAMRATGHAFDGRLVANASATWHWLATAGSARVDVPAPLVLDVIPDSAPTAELLLPAGDTSIGPGASVALRIGAGDDHGLASVMLEVAVERRGVVGAATRRSIASQPGTSWDGTAVVDPSLVQGADGDVLHVRAVAVDASPWAQAGASRTLRVRVRTSEERREHARELGDAAVAAADAAARAQRELAQRTEDAARARDRSASASSRPEAQAEGTPASMSHEAGERARTIAQEQRQLVEKVEALRDAAARLEKGLREAGALDSSLARQLREAQDLMRQALSPELTAQMQRLEQAAQQLNGEDARTAMRDLAQMQQQLREQLEQSAEMLKRAAHEGAMQTLSDEARELGSRQRALGDSAARGQVEGRREAQALADRSERYADEVQQLKERLAKDRATAAAEGTGEARDAARRAEELLREPAGRQASGAGRTADAKPQPNGAASRPNSDTPQPRAGDPQQNGPPASQASAAGAQVAEAARDAASQMDRASEAMQQARDAQVKEWKQELTAELDRAVQETLQLAREERALEQQARAGSTVEQLRSKQGSVQQGVERTGERLRDAGKRSSLLSGGAQRAMAEARERVQAATREMAQSGQAGQRGGAETQADALAEAAESLNRAAASLARDRERANSASSASGFAEMMQQLQETAKKQGSINGQAQSLMQMPGGQQSAQGAQMARALARQQQQVAQQLDDIGEEAGGGRTGELAREARQLAEALAAGRLDARTAARQEQLFKRLLDAGRSLEKEEREDTDRREARAATGTQVHAPGSTDARGRDARRFREPTWEELRGLTADERRAILEYFRKINGGTP